VVRWIGKNKGGFNESGLRAGDNLTGILELEEAE